MAVTCSSRLQQGRTHSCAPSASPPSKSPPPLTAPTPHPPQARTTPSSRSTAWPCSPGCSPPTRRPCSPAASTPWAATSRAPPPPACGSSVRDAASQPAGPGQQQRPPRGCILYALAARAHLRRASASPGVQSPTSLLLSPCCCTDGHRHVVLCTAHACRACCGLQDPLYLHAASPSYSPLPLLYFFTCGM